MPISFKPKSCNYLLFYVLIHFSPAWAQRADENVITSAQDAFGTTVGEESIGLYSAGGTRGFSPSKAGNIRVEGLYFIAAGPRGQAGISNRLIDQTTMRVGLSAQSYPFPSPTGIVDHSLRLPGDDYALSVVAKFGPYESTTGQLDAQFPIVRNKFSLGIGVDGGRTISDVGASSYSWSAAAIGRWRIGDDIEVIPFWNRTRNYEHEFQPFIFTAGLFSPPKYKRGAPYGLDWAETNAQDTSFGVIARANWSDWQLRFGVFRAENDFLDTKAIFYFDTQPDGSAIRWIYSFPDFPFLNKATSGEARLSKSFNESSRRHILNINARGQSSVLGFGGIDRFQDGPATLGVPTPIPEPAFETPETGRQKIRRGSIGLNYKGQWRDVGEFSAGVQRVFYNRLSINPNTETADNYWLYNTTLSAYLTDLLVLYGSYTRGLEDSPIAPSVAVNSGEGVPASLTRQVDAGLRYQLSRSLRLVAGLFEIKKPFFELDSTNFYQQLGTIRHQGVEVSLAGQPIKGLTIVTGFVLLKARLSGELVDQGVIGKVPIGSIPMSGLLNAQYEPENWRGFSVDGRVVYDASYFADAENTFKGSAITTLDLGARYRFKISELAASLRLQLANVLNSYEWRVAGGSRQFTPTAPRKFTLQLTVDF